MSWNGTQKSISDITCLMNLWPRHAQKLIYSPAMFFILLSLSKISDMGNQGTLLQLLHRKGTWVFWRIIISAILLTRRCVMHAISCGRMQLLSQSLIQFTSLCSRQFPVPLYQPWKILASQCLLSLFLFTKFCPILIYISHILPNTVCASCRRLTLLSDLCSSPLDVAVF